jgi:protein gp37
MNANNIEEILHHYPEVKGIHPACLAVPSIESDDRVKLEESIGRDGLRHEILLTDDGLLVDGRNRLLACFNGKIEPRFRKITADPWQVAFAENIARRHLDVKRKAAFGLAWQEHEKQEAKKRYEERPKGGRGNKVGENIFTDFAGPDVLVCTSCHQRYNKNAGHLCKGKSRDKIGERVGVSGTSVDKVAVIKEYAPEKLADNSSLEQAYKEAATRRKQQQEKPADIPVVQSVEMTKIITAKGVESEIPLPKKVVFNHTNDSVDWASWTWNPVTGCEHGCSFCYAREIANSQRMAPYYPNGFEPTFHPYRLAAPKNSSVPTSADQRDGRVFVCSMADLFGKWVPNSWIRYVFDACIESPEWEYLFLTKWPARYSAMPLIQNAWYGSSVIRQSDVSRVESAMCKFSGDGIVKWVSLEPMTEPIRFNDISWCDLMVIGGQTSTNQPDGFVPEFAPDFDWVFDVVDQCRSAGVPYYIKANLGLARPGMKLPNPQPRGRQ